MKWLAARDRAQTPLAQTKQIRRSKVERVVVPPNVKKIMFSHEDIAEALRETARYHRRRGLTPYSRRKQARAA